VFPKTNYLIIGGIVLACFVFFGFGGYYLGKQSNKTQNITTNTETPPTSAPIVSLQSTYPSITPSSSNKSTYTYGSFSFSYPKTWQLSEDTTDPSFFVQNKMMGYFDHMVLLQNGDYYFLIGIDTYDEEGGAGGIFLSDKDYLDYIKNRDEVNIQGKRFFLRKDHTSLTYWNDPKREEGILVIASLSEYIPNKATNNENKTVNGYAYYIENKNGKSYAFIKFSKTDSDGGLTPASIQSDIKGMLESIKW